MANKKTGLASGFSILLTVAGKAVTAINRSAVGGLEGNLGFHAAFGADCSVHFTIARTAFPATAGAAVGATAWFVGKTLLCVEFLFAGGEGKFSPTVTAC